jgi:glycosyltransferase involved in cell wall biosynthesis
MGHVAPRRKPIAGLRGHSTGNLSREKEKVALVTFGGYLRRSWIKQDLELLEQAGFRARGLALPYRYPNPMDLVWLLSNLRTLLSSRAVLVWFAFPGPVLMSRMFGKRVVTNAVGYEVAMHRWLGYGEPLSPFARALISIGLRFSDRTIAISQESAGWAMKLGAGQTDVVYEAVDPGRFSPGPPGARPEGGSIVTVSFLSAGDVKRKDLSTLLQAFANVVRGAPAARLTIIGDKLDGYPRLAREARALGVEGNVEFAGYLSFPDMLDRLRRSDEFVLPSLHEGFPTVLCEALLCGVPIVTTNLPSMNEIFTDGEDAFLVPPRDPERLGEAMAALLVDRGLASRLAATGRALVQARFSPGARGKALWDVLSEVSGDARLSGRQAFSIPFFFLYLGLSVVSSGWVLFRKVKRRFATGPA